MFDSCCRLWLLKAEANLALPLQAEPHQIKLGTARYCWHLDSELGDMSVGWH